MIQYKVTVNALPQGEEIIMEMFEARSDADQFYAQLQDPEQSVLAGLPYSVLCICEQEFHNGMWTPMSKKLVTK